MLPTSQESQEHPAPTTSQDDRDFRSVADRLEAQRRRSHEFLSEQRERLSGVDQELIQNLTLLQQQASDWAAFQGQLQQQHDALTAELQAVTQRHETLEQRDTELQQRETQLRESRRQLAVRIRRHRGRKHGASAEEAARVGDEIARLQQQIQELQQQTEEERRTHQELVASCEEQIQLQKRLEAELNTARGSLAEQRAEEKELRQQLARSRAVLNERAQQITELRAELEKAMQLQEQAANQAPAVDVHEFMELRRERDELHEQVTALQQAQQQLIDQGGSESDYQSLQRRFDILVEKVRDLKNRNAELESELASWRGGSTQPPGGAFDWQQQKQQLLRQMEGNETDGPDSDEPSNVASGSSAHYAEELEVEREQLRKLQEEWHNKLRSAEVEISIERAENARLRSQLQEKMRELETKMKAIEKQSEKETGSSKPRRRWMDRLGLSGDDE